MNTPRCSRYVAILLTLSCVLLVHMILPATAHAQDGNNLLANPGFDGALTPVGIGAVPSGWGIWGNAGNSDKESLSALTRSAPYSWRFRRDYQAFTAGGYQTVAVQPGATYQFSAFAMIWTCNDEEFACRNENGTYSDTSSGGRVRIGIDPAGGTNPFAGTVQWSGFQAPFTWGSFAYLSVSARAAGGQMTVFTYYTSDQDMRFQDVFWDDAALVQTADANNPNNNDGNIDDDTPRATAVPVSVDPVTRDDGALVHIVQPGQSLWTISHAYDVPLDTLRTLNGLTGSDTIFSGQELVVQAAPQNPTNTPRPTVRPTSTTTPTITPNAVQTNSTQPPTLVGADILETTQQDRTPTADIANRDSDNDEGGLESGIAILAVIIVIAGLGGIGAVLYIMWQVFNPAQPPPRI